MSIERTLSERGGNYGDYSLQCRITQNIKRAMADSPNWYILADDQREALEMIAVKAARILNGNPDHYDSWHDIIGYVRLVERRLNPPPIIEGDAIPGVRCVDCES